MILCGVSRGLRGFGAAAGLGADGVSLGVDGGSLGVDGGSLWDDGGGFACEGHALLAAQGRASIVACTYGWSGWR